jgi:nucleoside phosphorylase/CheY-like chemotaxis protein
MISILIVDDDSSKVKNIRRIVDKYVPNNNYDIAQDMVLGARYLSAKQYDLLILDLNLPERAGDDLKPENGIKFLDQIKNLTRLIKPFHIIGLSAFDEYINKYRSQFDDDLWALIKYDSSTNSWEKKLGTKLSYLIESKKSIQNPSNIGYNYDIAIVTALRSELDSILELEGEWTICKNYINDATEYHTGIFQNGEKKIRVVASTAPQMGMAAASVLTMKMIHNYRPKYIAMTGIAGGLKGVGNFGDVLIADISFDSGSGKIKSDLNGDSKFEPDYKSIPLETDLKEALIACKANKSILREIKDKCQFEKPATELDLHIGPFATGAGVIENQKIIEEIKGHNRKLIGIDMETYGVFYAWKNCSKPRPIAAFSFKSLSDFADPEKNDRYQKYAAYTSARLLHYFALNKISYDM